MKLSRLSAFMAGSAAILAALSHAPAFAQQAAAEKPESWPQRHISLVVAFAAGSSSDVLARLFAVKLSESLGQQIVVENVAGAGGTIGTGRVARAEPNGYQMLLGSVDTLAQNASLYKSPPYNAITDFTPVSYVGDLPLVLVAANGLPVTGPKDFAQHLKANGKSMQFGSSGLGSATHLSCSQLNQLMGGEAAHVPYRGTGPGIQDMIAGQIHFLCSLAPSVMPLIEGKQIKALAVLTKERSPFLPAVPSISEAGFNTIDAYAWYGFVFPKGTPEVIVARMHKAIDEAIDSEFVREKLKTLAVNPASKDKRSPAYLKKLIEDETAKWAVIIKDSGVVLN